jgi:catechol 2,3-dioxygenase-like lactoylglutathione lyase family enzyme
MSLSGQAVSPFSITKLSHVNFYYTDFQKAIAFYVSTLGFKPSDIIDSNSPHPLATVLGSHPLCFLRLNSDHHSSALFPDLLRIRDKRKDTAIQQFSWEVRSYDQIRKGLDFLNQNQVEIDFVGRRMPGSNYNLYFWDPEGFRIEMTWGMEQVGWYGRTKPLAFWNELRMHDKLPEPPVLPDEEESRNLAKKIFAGSNNPSWSWAHSLDKYEVEKWQKEASVPESEVEGMILQRPFKLTRPAYLGLEVKDLSRSLDFYTKILGFKLVGYLDASGDINRKDHLPSSNCSDSAESGVALLLGEADSVPGGDFNLCLYSADSQREYGFKASGAVIHSAFEVSSLKQLKDAEIFLEEQGIDIVAKGRVRPFGDDVLDLRDPHGWVIRLVYRNRKSQVNVSDGGAPLWSPFGDFSQQN